MASSTSPFVRDTAFDPFLFAEVGEERNGMLLSVVSALARLDLDPWREAASLSRLPATAATERLTSLLASLPSSQITVPAPAAVLRLIGLLPKSAPEEGLARQTPAAPIYRREAAKSKKPWLMAAFVLIAVLMLCAAQFVSRPEPRTVGGATPAASSAEPAKTLNK